MADKLALWNAALQEIGAPRLGSLTETAKARYELDNCYANVVADCLRAGSWNFALRTSYFDHDASVTPAISTKRERGSPTSIRSTCSTCRTTPAMAWT
jgi:hypothetical protein